MSDSKPVRMTKELELTIEGIRIDLERTLDKPITQADAQRVLARASTKPITIIVKSKRSRRKLSEEIF